MSIINSQPLIGASGQGGYFLTKSLRFRSSASAYLNRTPASAGNRRTWTWSGWVKRGILSATSDRQVLFGGYGAGNDTDWFELGWGGSSDGYDKIYCTTNAYNASSTAVYRDPSAWYHIVYVVDTTQATQANRIKVYVNGSQITYDVSSYVPVASQNAQLGVNGAWNHNIAKSPSGSSRYFDGYLTEVNFIDGQALTPSSFGETSTSTGVWIPKKYTGTYGTNGFYLPFTDVATTSGSNAGLGKDFSGNGNYWTTNNISVTSGATYDSMKDVPTLTNATTANYCTLNPLRNTLAAYGTISDGNLKVNGTQGAINCIAAGTMTFSGKMYCEMTIEVRGNDTTGAGVGIVPTTNNQFQTAINMSTGIYYLVSGQKEVTGTNSAYGSSYTTGDVIGIAVDVPAETVTFYKNNVSQGSISGTGIISAGVVPYIGFQDSGSPSIICNFGQQPFVYTPPSGFVAMNTFNLPTPTIGATASSQAGKYFGINLWTGNGSTGSRAITGLGFKPDWVWWKNRTTAKWHQVFDSNRGADKALSTNATDAEDASGGYGGEGSVTSFDTDGYTLQGGVGNNENGSAIVGWAWQAGQGTNVTNTAGSITSTVSANTTAGFSIVTYTGTGSNATVGHGLGVAPKMVIVKKRSGTSSWPVYHANLTSASYYLLLESTSAETSNNIYWQGTAPTSTVFSIGTTSNTNENASTYVAYCFAQVAGYSAFGSYTGNGSSDGTFVYTGFRPRFILIKESTPNARGWRIFDTARNPYNQTGLSLAPNASDAEDNGSNLYNQMDILSNGFKLRAGTNSEPTNESGATYIYAAFAESPFKFALAR